MTSPKTTEIPLERISDLQSRLPAANTADVTIEVLGKDLGDQVQAQRLPWHSLIYDLSNDILELSVGGRDHRVPVVLRHEIHHPSRVWTEEFDGSVRAISIESSDESQTIVRFHQRPKLSPG
ncbi:MAG: DUF5335 family protein [Acidimicrobiia bacterium]